jgi:hypothetical protein
MNNDYKHFFYESINPPLPSHRNYVHFSMKNATEQDAKLYFFLMKLANPSRFSVHNGRKMELMSFVS